MAQAAAFTLLNPHDHLNTVLLVGSVGAQQPVGHRGWFIASFASVAGFVLLGYGAHSLASWFVQPRAWQLLDRAIGATMFVLTALLLRHALGGG